MSEEEIKNEKPNQIIEIISEIFDLNKDIQKEQKGSGIKNTNTKSNAQQITNYFNSVKCRK